MQIHTPISLGELVDKLTILEIKLDRMTDPAKLKNVDVEHRALKETLSDVVDESGVDAQAIDVFKGELKTINEKLWQIEDDIRECERKQDFSEQFVELARAVYFTNDKRAATKNALNLKFGSELVEEKSYESY